MCIFELLKKSSVAQSPHCAGITINESIIDQYVTKDPILKRLMLYDKYLLLYLGSKINAKIKKADMPVDIFVIDLKRSHRVIFCHDEY